MLAQLGANVGRMAGLFMNLIFMNGIAAEPNPARWIPPFFPVVFLFVQYLLLTFVFTT